MKIYNLIYTRLLEHILLENRIDFLKNQFKDKLTTNHDRFAKAKTSDEIVDFFANNADPSKNKMFTQWILNQYRASAIRQEDYPRIKDVLSSFEKYKGKLEKKDINQYKSLSDVEDSIEPLLGQATSKKQETKQVKSEGAVLIYKEGPVTIHKLLSQEAACYYGAGTKWCTAAKQNNMFDYYNIEGPLYVIQARDKSGKIAKFQFHAATESLMDTQDKPVDINLFTKNNPEILNAKEINVYFPGYYTSSEKIMQGLQSTDEFVRYTAISSKYVTPENISKALDDEDWTIRKKAIQNSKATLEHITKALNDRYYEVRAAAVIHQKATTEHISKALEDTHLSVREAALSNPNVTEKQLAKALTDEDNELRAAAIAHPKITPEQLTQALESGDWLDRESVFQNPNVTPELITIGLNDPDSFVRAAAISSSKATIDNIRQALNDEDQNIRKLAQQKLKKLQNKQRG